MVRVLKSKNAASNATTDMVQETLCLGRSVALGCVHLHGTNVHAADMGGCTVIGYKEKRGDGRHGNGFHNSRSDLLYCHPSCGGLLVVDLFYMPVCVCLCSSR